MPALRTILARARAAVPLLLTACALRPALQTAQPHAPVPRYVPPGPAQDAAPVSMRADIPVNMYYMVDVFADTPTCTGRQHVGRSFPLTEMSPTKLATERWQTLDVVMFQPGSVCWARVSFTPRHGRSYRLTPHYADGHCNAYVFDTTDPEAPQLESSLRYRRDATATCVPLARAGTAYQNVTPQVAAVDVRDLPTDPDTDALTPAKAPKERPKSPVKPTDTVTDDDLNGLTGH